MATAFQGIAMTCRTLRFAFIVASIFLCPQVSLAQLSSTVGGIKVDLVSGKLAPLAYMHQTISGLKQKEDGIHLILKIRVTNESLRPITYRPWYSNKKDGRIDAFDEKRIFLSPWFSEVGTWPVGGLSEQRKLPTDASVLDVIAFAEPSGTSKEITVQLTGKNVERPGQWFEFKINRKFFETKEQAEQYAARKIIEDREAIAAKEAAVEQAKARAEARERAVAAAIIEAKRKAERDAIAAIAAAEAAKERERVAAEKEKIAEEEKKNRKVIIDQIRVEVVSGSIGHIETRSNIGNLTFKSKDKFLLAKIKVSNETETKLITFRPWYDDNLAFINEKRATMTDEFNNSYVVWRHIYGTSRTLIGSDFAGTITRVHPGKSIVDTVALEIPIEKAVTLTLRLPARNVGLVGQPDIVFKLPRSFFSE